jgi:anti-anti-sigma factor
METPFYDAFISYTHSDKDLARNIAKELMSRKFDIFFDEYSISYGDNIPQSIEKALEKSNKIILLISSDSIKSEWVSFERSFRWIDTYLKGENKIIPVIVDKCDIPTSLQYLKCIDLSSSRRISLKNLAEELAYTMISSTYVIKLKQVKIENISEYNSVYITCILRIAELYYGYKTDRLISIRLCFNELLKNAFQHTENSNVYFEAEINRIHVILTFQDDGKGFDILKTYNNNLLLLNESPEISGKRGIILLHNICDEIYNSIHDSNHKISSVIRKESTRIQLISFEEFVESSKPLSQYISREKGIVFLKFNGSIDTNNCKSLKQHLINSIEPTIYKYIMDCSGVPFIDSSGVALFVEFFFKYLRKPFGKECKVLIIATPAFKQLVELARLEKVFSFAENIEEAIRDI